MKIFITGATGFIGKYLVKRLAKTSHEQVCLVRKTSNTVELQNHKAQLVYGDVTDRKSLLEGMKGCDWVINLANIYSMWEPDNSIFERVNIEGTRHVMECALETGIAKVAHVSTSAIWGRPATVPFTEETPVGPKRANNYARTKYEGDLIALDLYKNKGLPLVMIYPAAVLGIGDNKSTGKYILDLLNRRMPALAFPDTILTYVHVQDVADAILMILEKKNNIGEKYLIGNERLSISEINKIVSSLSGVALPKLCLPGPLVKVNALLLTAISRLTKWPPLWNMSTDQVGQMVLGIECDGC